jgi:hypothetical protein
MHPLIENNRETIAGLCRRHGVQKLEAVGSVLGEDFDPHRSDVDLWALRIFAATVRHGTATAAVPGPTRLARAFLLETKAWFARHGAA